MKLAGGDRKTPAITCNERTDKTNKNSNRKDKLENDHIRQKTVRNFL